MSTVRSWSDARYEETVRQQYAESLPLIEWLRVRAKPSST